MSSKQERSNLEMLLRELSLDVQSTEILRRNIETIRENFRRIKQYLDDIGVDQLRNITQIITNQVSVDITAFNRSEEFDVSFNGQTNFTLADTPNDPETSSQFLVNTAQMVYGAGYTISGATAIFDPVAAGFTLESNNEFSRPDKIVVNYSV